MAGQKYYDRLFKPIVQYFLLISILIIFSISDSYSAQGSIDVSSTPTPDNSNTYRPHQNIPVVIAKPPKIQLNAAAWVLMDYDTGVVLTEKNMNVKRKPASLTKILTTYVIGQALEHDSIQWDEKVTISKKAWKTGGSKMFIKPGDQVTVGTLVKGIIIPSGNDATIALAEFVAGSDAAFTQLMNHTAQQLGMNDSHFSNPDGLPAKDQYTTAYDMAILSCAFIHAFPDLYKLYKEQSFTYNGITQYNRNRLLKSNPNVDGIKTGYTKEAGFNLASSAVEDGRRLIGIILGASSDTARTEESNKLLTYGFRFFENYEVATPAKPVAYIKIDNAQDYDYKLPVSVNEDIILSLAKGQDKQLEFSVTPNENLQAPIKKDQQVGNLAISLDNQVIVTKPVFAENDVDKSGFFGNIFNHIKSWF